ncbi:MAG TPA: type II toxin-antitoxin system VapB family antitoxin [Actinomycetospora sp.]|jgi:antitoxin VapB|uniref:type II toxin-antitoxin system VapB family antitoxin n=1 Tax=Actinomycetospora sp. TaxID=1872135 RepID=UPI002F4288B7
MALNIKDAETDRLTRELAAATGETITEALRLAVQERLARVRQRGPRNAAQDALSDIVRRGRARSSLDDRSAEEILGYGPDGLPA